jgi:hypothetical protein
VLAQGDVSGRSRAIELREIATALGAPVVRAFCDNEAPLPAGRQARRSVRSGVLDGGRLEAPTTQRVRLLIGCAYASSATRNPRDGLDGPMGV